MRCSNPPKAQGRGQAHPSLKRLFTELERSQAAMHARVSIFEGDPDKIDHGLRYWREEVQPAQETLPGFKGAVSLHDRQNRHNGRTISITFWESEEHMHDNREDHNRVLSKVAETPGRELVGVEWYEVGLFELKV
jgi:heme-degrading monooxygenase HmoA